MLELSPTAVSGSRARIMSADFAQETQVSVSPMRSPGRLHCSLTMTGYKHMVVLGSPEIRTGVSPDRSLGQQDCLWTAAGRG